MKKLILVCTVVLLSPFSVFALDDTDLVSWWACEETSGVRYDSHGSNDLTDNNTVGYSVSGKVGNACDFESTNSEYLSISDGSQSGLDITGDFSLSFWVYYESWVSNIQYGWISKLYNESNGWVFYERYNAGEGTRFCSSATTCDYHYDGLTTTGTWYHITLVYDSASGEATIHKNNSLFDTLTGVTSYGDNTADFGIGAYENGAGTWVSFMDGLIDEISFWDKQLSEEDRDDLYNSGSGMTYDDLEDGTGTTSSTTDITSSFGATTTAIIESAGTAVYMLILTIFAIFGFYLGWKFIHLSKLK